MAHCRKFGVAIDIDGVLMKGSKLIPRASDAIVKLIQHNVPYIFITNGGGTTEVKKAQSLGQYLQKGLINKQQQPLTLRKEQMLLSHTPFRDLATQYKDNHVLVLGRKEKCIDIVNDYGINAVFPIDIYNNDTTTYPNKLRKKPKAAESGNTDISISSNSNSKIDIAAACIFHDPVDWGLDIQILTDVLLGKYTKQSIIGNSSSDGGLNQMIPLYASNADLVYKTEHDDPRFTQGAFAEAFRSIFDQYTQTSLNIHYCGKPFNVQYKYAEKMIQDEHHRLLQQQKQSKGDVGANSSGSNSSSIVKYYGIGDNPLSDIKGANAAGAHWSSILVRTGLFTDADNDLLNPADHVTHDILDAVNLILELENVNERT